MKLLCAILIVSAAMTAPASARHLRHAHVRALPYDFGYSHNYGPGLSPGTFAYYDGPLRLHCDQSAAAYRGQDGRQHPCF